MNTWKITYYNEKYHEDCLEQFVLGTREDAEHEAEKLAEKTGRNYKISDGTTTFEWFKG